jgi:ribonuclease T2
MPPSPLPGRLLRRLVLLVLLALPAPAAAEGARFDHYLLALTWMPSFCLLEGDARDDARCAPGSGHGWMVHGLWPQNAGGAWPEYCPTGHRNPSRRETAAQADLFGAAGPAWHQWNKHGRCTGLSARDYYALTRAVVGALTLPDTFATTEGGAVLAPEAVEAAFIEANPGLDAGMMIATCRRDLIVELRLCLTRDLQPRSCDQEVLQRGCAREAAHLPAPRTGTAH